MVVFRDVFVSDYRRVINFTQSEPKNVVDGLSALKRNSFGHAPEAIQ